MVETVGVEPTSKNISGRLSPSADMYLISPDERHMTDSHQTIPLSPLTLAGGYVRGFLHCRRRDSGLQVNRSRRAGLNYAASAKLLFVLAFLLNGYFLRGSPPRLAYPRSTYLSKPVRPHEYRQLNCCRNFIIAISKKLSIWSNIPAACQLYLTRLQLQTMC